MLKLFFLAVLGVGLLNQSMAEEAKGKNAPAKDAGQPARVSASFSRWIEREKLAAPKTTGSWVSGDVGVRVLVIRR